MLLFQQLTKDKKSLEDKLQETNQALADEEEKAKGLAKQKAKQDALIADLEERLRNSEKVGNELVQSWYWFFFCCQRKSLCDGDTVKKFHLSWSLSY